MGEQEEVTLLNIAKGAAVELFDREFQKVLANIADPTTEAETKRKIVLEITLEPNEDRTALFTSVQAKSTQAPIRQVPTTIYVRAGKVAGRHVAMEYDPKQSPLFEEKKPEPLRAVASASPVPAPPVPLIPEAPAPEATL